LAVSVPHAEGHVPPVKLQVTAVSGFPDPAICAVNVWLAPAATVALAGEIVICTLLAIVMVAAPLAAESAALIAVIVMLAGEGRIGGAVYNPPAVIVPSVEFPPATPSTAQATVVSGVPVTLAVICCVPPRKTFALAGETVTLMTGGGGGGLLEAEPPAVPQWDSTPAKSIARRNAAIDRNTFLLARPTCRIAPFPPRLRSLGT
jgi:hypothetical protein